MTRSLRENIAFYCLVLLMIAAAAVLVMDLKPNPTVTPQKKEKEQTEQTDQTRTPSVQNFTEERLVSTV